MNTSDDCILDPEAQSRALPLRLYVNAVESMVYGSLERVCFQILIYTGCRVCEIGRIKAEGYERGTLSWRLGKNQIGWRSETIPESLVEEITFFRRTHRVDQEYLIGLGTDRIRRCFNEARKNFGPQWQERAEMLNTQDHERYVYGLKAARKTFQTIVFHHHWRKYGDATMALLMTSKRMKHSCKEITALHYIEALSPAEVDAWTRCVYVHKPEYTSQKVLGEYENGQGFKAQVLDPLKTRETMKNQLSNILSAS